MQYQIRELGIGGILDQAISLVKNHFGQLFGITLVMLVPCLVVLGFIGQYNAVTVPANPTMQDIQAIQQQQMQNLVYIMPVALFYLVIALPITNAAIIAAVANQYLGHPITIGAAFGRAFGSVLGLIGTGILLYLAVFGGMLLCVIPGILCAFWFSLAWHVVILERTSGFAALKRSKFLMKGNIGTVFVLGLLVGIIQFAIGFGVKLIPEPNVLVFANAFVTAALQLFAAAAFVVFYFSCRCKAEQFDLALLAESLGAAPPEEPIDDVMLEG
jgi:uncharacterized membrane protein